MLTPAAQNAYREKKWSESKNQEWECFRIKGVPFCRGVAQPGSAPALGAGGRVFESRRPDQTFR
jgi:hypothetical protein